MALTAITDRQNLEGIEQLSTRLADLPIFEVVHIAPHIKVETARMDCSPHDFTAIDATPCFTMNRIETFEDTNVFNLARVKTEEVLINRADMSVIEHLEAIKALQSEKQKEIRQRILREAGNAGIRNNLQPRMSVIAQLIHLEEAA